MRRFVIAAAVLAALVWPGASSASGETYTLVQCGPLNRTSDEATLVPSVSYSVRSFCASSEHGFALRIDNVVKARPGRSGVAFWEAPPGTAIVAVSAQVQLRNETGNRARVFIADREGHEIRRIANGTPSQADWEPINYQSVGSGHERLAISLSCEQSTSCPASDQAKAQIRNIRITLEDQKDPELMRVDGSLFDGGWLRGDQQVDLRTLDSESGIFRLSLTGNATLVRNFSGDCPGAIGADGVSKTFAACGPEVFGGLSVNSAVAPFRDGTNQVTVCGADFAANQTCVTKAVRVDNSLPTISFAPEQSPTDPEEIQASVADSTSGVSRGEILFRQQGAVGWRALPTELINAALVSRVDSSSEPPGLYEFRATVEDAAGNENQTTSRANGDPMVLSFPLRSGVQMTAQIEPGGSKQRTLRYGRPGFVAGKLLTADGRPLVHRDVSVVEHFGDGALISRRRRVVQTDSHGNWSERVPPGPSRRVTTSFAGDQRYLGTDQTAGRLFVRSDAEFRTSRRSLLEGKRIVFSGRVKHLGAHIPPGGKLVEVQVRERPGRWNTVRQAFYTNAAGRYRIGYRFGTFYVRDARFRFRVRVTREQGWAYKAPVHSAPRTVIVRARKK